ncbi:DNA-binding protein [Chryseobacterium indologenes]|uniref:helix-turn-helix domain-containing protein n=1 Tax=Chryseobacterium indologenes TaxID=253 RepID=UPI000B51C446|nr:helix-turn-helix domain-containing protein [Chryseobacterium indologenes]ASE62009.1 DNA-binding protein [Chryseobacterium indologenes]
MQDKSFIKLEKEDMKYTFDQIPNILKRIEERLDKIEEILLDRIQNEPTDIEFIGAMEACKILKISLPTLYSKVSLREVPFYKKGNRLHFSKAELLEWIQDGKKNSLADISEKGNDFIKNMEKKKWS